MNAIFGLGNRASAVVRWLFIAVQEQLGLNLQARKSPIDVLVIDHIDRPSKN